MRRCHGQAAEGTKKFPRALLGNKSVPQLSKLIADTMPDDDPGSCSAKDAEKVAAYIYDNFYSPAAQARNKPPRIELARLTVNQYRNSVADLIGSFRKSPSPDGRRGLHGEYFNARDFRGDRRVLERIDPEVGIDFGRSGPDTDKVKFEPRQFAIRWEGSVLASETGVYDFVIRTDRAARLWVNDLNTPLVDAWVKSGSDNEYRASLYLLAGRDYPLKLEFAKANQGVDDTKTANAKPPVPASISLEWKPPHGAAGVIPSRNLTPSRQPEMFTLTSPFPPDDRSLGWERGTTISKAWDEATTDAALETTAYIAAHLSDLSGVRNDVRDRGARLREFCKKFVERAFRRPLGEDQKRTFIDHQFEAAKDPELAVKRVVLLTLKSPRFLYREVGSGPDAYDVAARLAFTLWDSIPDPDLLAAAASGKLASPQEVARQAERMLADPRAHAKMRQFLLTWLKVDQAPELAKDPQRFPEFTPAFVADLRTSLELTLNDVLWGDSPDFRKLVLNDEVFLNDRLGAFYGVDLASTDALLFNARLAKFYGSPLPAEWPYQKVKLDSEQRAGVLTHPYILSAFAYTKESSPIHRGVFIARGVFGVVLRPPPQAVAPVPADLQPALTTRERVTLQTKPTNCMNCHGVINPVGFTLEHFDAVGRYREKENGKPIDSSGSYQTPAGKVVKFSGVRDLAKYLADNEDVHSAFVEQMFHHLVQQPVQAYGHRRRAELLESFSRNHLDMRKLIVDIAVASALTSRENKPGSLVPWFLFLRRY